jgi:hypothetical protein
MDFSTHFLAPASGFFLGMATVVNIPGNYYRYSYSGSGEEADARALHCDFAMVGKDIRSAIHEFESDQGSQLELPLS